jgi:hypothetical protein
MKKFLIFVAILWAVLVFAGENWNGAKDTCIFGACSASVGPQYSKPFNMFEFGPHMRLAAMVNDTNSAGYASDSVAVQWGYRPFSRCYNTSNALDTCYGPAVIVDTLLTADFGVNTDTTHCTGFAVQSVNIGSPSWDAFYQVWVKGLTGNRTVTPLRLRFTIIRDLETK